MSVREEVEQWLQDAPDSVNVERVGLERRYEKVREIGKIAPTIVEDCYVLSLEIKCHSWEGEE